MANTDLTNSTSATPFDANEYSSGESSIDENAAGAGMLSPSSPPPVGVEESRPSSPPTTSMQDIFRPRVAGGVGGKNVDDDDDDAPTSFTSSSRGRRILTGSFDVKGKNFGGNNNNNSVRMPGPILTCPSSSSGLFFKGDLVSLKVSQSEADADHQHRHQLPEIVVEEQSPSSKRSGSSSRGSSPRSGGGVFDFKKKKRKKERRRRKKPFWLDLDNDLHPYFVTLRTLCLLSIFSVLGESFRVFLGHLFGEQCEDGYTSWLYPVVEALNLCVTSGTGALFVDLPANMLGSFIMGMLQPTQDLGLLSSIPIAFLPARHWFQTWHAAHMALRTGFCGSLTTFASWNTQMVAMIDGTITGVGSEFFAAVFGYVIGLEAALMSLALGQRTAVWLHRYTNPHLARAEDVALQTNMGVRGGAALDSKVRHQRDATLRINRQLPDFERRYLDSLLIGEEVAWVRDNVAALQDLDRWKASTETHRRQSGKNSEHLRGLMDDIEHRILVDGEEPGELMLAIADEMGWDVDALQRWANAESSVADDFAVLSDHDGSPSSSSSGRRGCSCSTLLQIACSSLPVIAAVGLVAMYGTLSFTSDEFAEYYRSLWLSAMMAPFGTVLRWKLSALNGRMQGWWTWFPLGTFAANMTASVISALANGFLYRPVDGPGRYYKNYYSHSWSFHALEGVKTGFAGSLSTVSTYVVEASKLRASFPHHAKGMYYTVGSLAVACVLGLVVYCPFVRMDLAVDYN